MAPIGTVDMLGWFSSPEIGIISLVVFLILSAALLTLCIQCKRNTGNAYDVNGTTIDGAGGPSGTKTGGDTDAGTSTSWRTHQMPPPTLERPHAQTH